MTDPARSSSTTAGAATTSVGTTSAGSLPPSQRAREPSTGELMRQLSEQTSSLVRAELQLAQVEMTEKAKKAGIGAGLFGGAGVVALYGVGALVATIILVLVAIGLAPWLSALIVTVVLFAIAGVAALMGKKQVAQATPAAPERTIDNVKKDVETVKEARQS
jgi:uncharacterized membrane protein YqjE